MKKQKVAIFASGSGTNAKNIVNYFHGHHKIEVVALFCNNENAGVLNRLKDDPIEMVTFTKDELKSGIVTNKLKSLQIDFVVLAGFLWLIPESMIEAYENKIVNIHPALLPNYGGKGMFGMNVHEAVIKNGDTETGITIHIVNKKYDEGYILFQAKCFVVPKDTPESIATKVHQLEHQYFPEIIERWIGGPNNS